MSIEDMKVTRYVNMMKDKSYLSSKSILKTPYCMPCRQVLEYYPLSLFPD
jgi:hypothetical protein